MRLGCGAQVVGRPGLHGYSGRPGHHAPHLSVSLAHLQTVLRYLKSVGITMYRLSPDLAPFATHPDYPHLHHQLEECADELAAVGAWVRTQAMRLSFHAPSTVALATVETAIADQSRQQLRLLAQLLDAMALDREAVVVVHTGGLAGGADAAIDRWVAAWDLLPPSVQARLALEHDTIGASLGVALRIHAVTGVPVVFDHLHWLLHNPEGYDLGEALGLALATWPTTVRPKVHFASPRTELRVALKAVETPPEGQRRVGRRRRWVLSPPRPGHHSDLIHPWEFARFVEAAAGLRDFDVLLEAKASDLAVLRLREDLARYVPAVAAWLASPAVL